MKQKWNLDNIPDLSGKTIIVTGGNSGLGFETIKSLSAKGSETILACRNEKDGKYAKEKILEEYPNAQIDVMNLDLADLKSVHLFAINFNEKYHKIDVLLNNAGIMCPYKKTKDGFEIQIGTNHLGHFALTGLLLHCLKETKGSRVVNVSSLGHKFGKMSFDNFMFEKGGYSIMKAYGKSKLCNLLFTYELQRRFEKVDIDCIAVAAHPGVAKSNLSKYVTKKPLYKIGMAISNLIMSQNSSMGALPEIRASVDPLVKGGDYFGPGGFQEWKGYPVKVKSNDALHNLKNAKKLWEISENLTKIRYDFGEEKNEN
ncbi:oxidoreductase [Nitrosopumilus sp.]|uniref:oxidoreductase n=1 Tax=Nitrosopumilus sp. TaxID=2024843 RepID=UPI002931E399|nr:oxidoreductase [Nitrosopumilus sp.]